MKSLKNKVALITGAGSGIGAATAMLMAVNGSKVIVSDIDEAAGKEVVHKIKGDGGQAYFVKADVSNARQCKDLVAAAVKQYGRLDIAFNNAGIGGKSSPVSDMDIKDWDKMIGTNLSSVFYCMKFEIEAMQKAKGGVIVNMSSILGQVGFAGACGYVAAKHGIIGLTQTAAIEYAAKGIRVNAVGPGFIETPLLSKAGIDADTQKLLVSSHPIGRLGKSEEVAELVLWLSSQQASFISGAYYPVDGGYLCR